MLSYSLIYRAPQAVPEHIRPDYNFVQVEWSTNLNERTAGMYGRIIFNFGGRKMLHILSSAYSLMWLWKSLLNFGRVNLYMYDISMIIFTTTLENKHLKICIAFLLKERKCENGVFFGYAKIVHLNMNVC